MCRCSEKRTCTSQVLLRMCRSLYHYPDVEAFCGVLARVVCAASTVILSGIERCLDWMQQLALVWHVVICCNMFQRVGHLHPAGLAKFAHRTTLLRLVSLALLCSDKFGLCSGSGL
ncbi:unnamed protein product [Symbiodinium natans]|uniref:Uncharacterized protein n=1 Tax=Symbiodinium natans TaxID=878477 RepID=A0A812VFW9_9DINO|nr:unnamed protein product [Symbiodinium natans]